MKERELSVVGISAYLQVECQAEETDTRSLWLAHVHTFEAAKGDQCS